MKRFLARTLLFLGLPFGMKGVASDPPQDPPRDLDRCLSAAKLSAEDVGCAVDAFFRMTGITDAAALQQFRLSIINAEIEARSLRRPMIDEGTVAATFTELMREISAPVWAGATTGEVHELRQALARAAPNMVAHQQGALAPGLWPIEALYVIHLLSLNGRLLKNEASPNLHEKSSSRSPGVTRSVVGSFATDPKTIEFISFRRRFLESQSNAAIVKMEQSIAAKLKIL